MSPTKRQRMWSRGKAVLGLLLLGAILAYLGTHAAELERLPRLSGGVWAGILGITVLGTLVSTRSVQSLLAAVGVRTEFVEMYWLHNAAYLLNLLPGRPGTVLRAHYLKKHHDFSFTRFGLFALYLTLLNTLVTGLVGLLCLLLVYGLAERPQRIFAILLAGSVILTASVLFLPLPMPPGRWRFSAWIGRFLAARRELIGRGRSLVYPGVLLFALYLLGVLRLGLIYDGLGLEVRASGLLLLGALGQLTLWINLTPGGLGVRELLLGTGATVLGVSVDAGLVAALVERGVSLGWGLVVGIPCAIWALRRQRRDQVSAAEIPTSTPAPNLDAAAPVPEPPPEPPSEPPSGSP